VACARVAKKPNHKSGCVNRPADAFLGHLPCPDFLPPSPPAEKATARQDQAGKASVPPVPALRQVNFN
jgi:hypothetical protein